MADDRRAERLVPYVKGLPDAERPGIEAIAMEMWDPYRQTVREQVPDGERKSVYLRMQRRSRRYHKSLAKCNDSLACAVEDPDFPLESRTECITLRLQIKPRLQVEPEPVGRAEIARQS